MTGRRDTGKPSVHACALRTALFALLAGTPSVVLAQVPYAQGPLLDAIAAMPPGSWKKVNQNSFSDVWTPSALRPLYRGTIVPPSKILSAWSSFAWDSNRGDLIIYGGGHANYSGNDVYRWRSRTLKWERAALPSETLYVGSNSWTAIDGAGSAPTSAHTYDNAVFLPLFDRYMNFGGAIYNSGSPYVRPSEDDPSKLRFTGPYLFDPSRASPDKVGGKTGSHVQREGAFPEILGGEMWQNRDIYKNLAGIVLPKSHVNGCTAYSDEADEFDVVYVASRTNPSATALDLYRYQITDVKNPALDKVTRVGAYWSSPSAQTTCAYDFRNNIVVRTGTNTSPFFYWDMDTPGSSNFERRVAVTGSVKSFVDYLTSIGRTVPYCAMDYDPVRANFTVWCGAGDVWTVKPPDPVSTSGWTVTRAQTPSGAIPPNKVGTGILGKWDYIPGFDVFIGIEDAIAGNVWVYKPVDWAGPGDGGDGTDPPIANVPPSVSLTSPANGTSVTAGTFVTLSAAASDSDGAVTRVEFRVNGNLVGSDSSSPYAVSWQAPAAGSYAITAQAYDDDGASTVTAPISLAASSATPSPGGAQTAVIQRGAGGAVSDTYLSIYHATTNFGASERMDVWQSSYVPLIRFAIFAAEGGPVPDGAIIDSATLHLYKGAYDNVLSVHAMRKPWIEREATWSRPRVGATWSVAGAGGAGSDYEATGDAKIEAPWSAGWMVFDVTGRVRKIRDKLAPNYGWRTVWTSGNANRMEIRASDYLLYPERRPKLEIHWH